MLNYLTPSIRNKKRYFILFQTTLASIFVFSFFYTQQITWATTKNDTYNTVMANIVPVDFAAQSSIDVSPLPTTCVANGNAQCSNVLPIVLNIVFSATGAIALIIITIAGFRYIVSRGEPHNVSRAKDTILYAVIGLAISIAALAIVNFVVGNI